MLQLTEKPSCPTDTNTRYMTFRVGHILIGLSITHLQEINRHVAMTAVPHAPRAVCGVINLRGQVVSVVDLRTIFGLPPCDPTFRSRNLIVQSQGERIGLWVDQVLDTVIISPSQISPTPANIDGVDGKFFHGVFPTESEVILIADIETILDLS